MNKTTQIVFLITIGAVFSCTKYHDQSKPLLKSCAPQKYLSSTQNKQAKTFGENMNDMKTEKTQRIVLTIQTVIQILTQQKTIEETTNILGSGEYIHPKSPQGRIYYTFQDAYLDNVQKSLWSGTLECVNANSPWYKATLNLGSPINSSYIVKTMNLKYIKKLNIEQLSSQELRGRFGFKDDSDEPNFSKETMIKQMSTDRYGEYYYVKEDVNPHVNFIIYTNKDNYNPSTEYPSEFNKLEMSYLISNQAQ